MADINSIVLPDGTEYPISDYYLPVAISNPTNGQVLKYDAENQVWYNGEDASGSSVLYGTSAPTSQLGTDGCLYVKYTEGTGGASDTVDALYVKLDGSWCQISTGGGGGGTAADISVDDTDLEYTADDVQEALEKVYKRMALAEYEQLSHAEKYNGTIYFITDVKGANQILTKEITDASIATFDTDRAENLIEVVCDIQYSQASGTPSPSNPLPIGVYDFLTLYHNDVNIWNEQWELGDIDVSTGQPYASNLKIRSKNFCSCSDNASYYFYCSNSEIFTQVLFYDESFNYLGRVTSGVYASGYHNPFNPSDYVTGARYFKLAIGQTYGTTYNNDISINYPSTDTQYHAFNGAYIPFGQTVANGVLDVTTGKLVITHGVYNLTGTENWSIVDSGATLRAFISGGIPNKKDSANGICNNFKFGSANNQGEFDMQMSYLRFNIYGIATTKEEFNAWIANNPVMVVYELATPQEIQLDSITLQALLNENNIWCDTGDTSVKYILSVGKAIS